VILMLAHWLAAQREPPATLRDLIMPGIITGLPCLLVLKQPDLGSAIVFVAILFFMLFWAGAKPSLLLLAASPGIGLVLAFSTVTWGVTVLDGDLGRLDRAPGGAADLVATLPLGGSRDHG